MKVKLTPAFIANDLRCPEGKDRIEYVDSEGQEAVAGLFIEVRSTSPGEGTWYLRYRPRDSRTTTYKRFGSTKDVGLADARKAARKLRAEIALGADPRAEERAKRSLPSLNDLFDMYMQYAKARKRSWKSDESIYRVHLRDRFGHLRIDMIKRSEVLEFHASLLQQVKPATADHTVKCLRRLLNFGMVEIELISKNPCSKFPLFNPDNRIFKRLTDEELSRLLQAIQTTESSAVRNMATWCLATCCRLAECLNAQWINVDRNNRRWYIPPSVSKSKRGRWVPLSDTAMDVLTQLTTEGRYDYLFVNERTKKPMTSFMPVWRRIRARAGLPHLRIHDLRGTGISLMAGEGVPLKALAEIAGHKDIRLTASTYARMSDASLLAAVQTTSRAIQNAIKSGSKGANDQQSPRQSDNPEATPPPSGAGIVGVMGGTAESQPEAA